jgi:RNA polymerase sigma-32 factor
MLLTLAQTARIAAPNAQIETVLEYQRTGNKDLLASLIESNVRLVMKVAKSYVRHNCSMEDLVSEGTIGIIDAANKYEPNHGANFTTYAQQWIRARVQEYVQKNSSAFKVGGRTVRTLFQSLARVMRKHGEDVDASLIARELDLDEAEVTEALQYMNRQGRSLNAPIGSEGRSLSEVKSDGRMDPEQSLIAREEQARQQSFFQGFAHSLTDREQIIYHERMLAAEPKGLKELSEIIGVSMERVRQIEKAIFNKLQSAAHNTLR